MITFLELNHESAPSAAILMVVNTAMRFPVLQRLESYKPEKNQCVWV